MNEGGGQSLLVRHFYQKAKIPLELRPVSGKTGFARPLILPESAKKSLSVHVWGKSEVQKIGRMPPGQRKKFIHKGIEDVSCLILSDGLFYPRSIKLAAREKKIALFVTGITKTKCKTQLKKLFASFQSQQQILPGGLLQIFGCGVLILGDSGVGKSECALELISRGHLFVSDDVVLVKKVADRRLIGSAASLSRNFMEIRGLGIINIKKIFGEKSVCPHADIDLIIMLKKWKEGKEYDRLGLKIPGSFRFLGVDIPKITIPLAPGRNISTLIEVACKVFLLKQGGYHAAQDITKKLDRALAAR
jgi:HPr kinase/phosphorylase